MDWRTELKEHNYTKATQLSDFLKLTEEDAEHMQEILETFPMSITPYYLSLIDKEDPNDPIRKMCIPSLIETDIDGSFDTSGEADNTVTIGVQHKYKETAMILSTNRCAMYCRHCFRKRLVGVSDSEIANNFVAMMSYVDEHKEISNVLVSGGDSFMLTNEMIERYLQALTQMKHLDFIRFGTRVPVVFPDRVLEDQELINIFRTYAKKKQIYIVTHFNHPRELTEKSKAVVRQFLEMGIIVKNQTVLLKGVNDDPKVLGDLLKQLTAAGVVPYYIFQCRPVRGVKNQFQVPLLKGVKIVDEAKNMQNGQGKCVRFCMSNPKGKVEILGQMPNGEMLFKYNQAKNLENASKIFTLKLEENQCWI